MPANKSHSDTPAPSVPPSAAAAHLNNPYLHYFLHLHQQQQRQQYPMAHQSPVHHGLNHLHVPPPPPPPPLPPPPPKTHCAASAAAARRKKTQAATAARMLRAKSSVVSSTTASSPAPAAMAVSGSNSRNTAADHFQHFSVPLSATLRSSATPATHLQGQGHGHGQGQNQRQRQSHCGRTVRGPSIASDAVTPEIGSPLTRSSLPADADAVAGGGGQRVNRRVPEPASAASSSTASTLSLHPTRPPALPMVAVKVEPPAHRTPALDTHTSHPNAADLPSEGDPNVALAIWRAVFDMHGIPAPPIPANLSAPNMLHQTPQPPLPPPGPLLAGPTLPVIPPVFATSAHSALPPQNPSHPSHPESNPQHDDADDDGDMEADPDPDHEDECHGSSTSASTNAHQPALHVPAADPQQELKKERKVNREQERRMKIKETTRKLGEVVGLPRQANMLVVLTHALEFIQTTRGQAEELKTLKGALLLEGIEYNDLITRAKARRNMQDAERVLSKPLSRSTHASSAAPRSSSAVTVSGDGHGRDKNDENDRRIAVDSVSEERKRSRTRAATARDANVPGTDSTSAADVAGALLALRGPSTASAARMAHQQLATEMRPQHSSSSDAMPSGRAHRRRSPVRPHYDHSHHPHHHQGPTTVPTPSCAPPHRRDSPIYIDHDNDEQQAHQVAAHESSFSLSPLFGATTTPFNRDHTDEEDLMMVDDEQHNHRRPAQTQQKQARHRVNGIVGSSVELDPWTPAPSAPPPPLAAPSSAPLHPPVSLPPPPPPLSEPPVPTITGFQSTLPPGPLTASILNAFAAAAAAAMAASHASNASTSVLPVGVHAMPPAAVPFAATPSDPSMPVPPHASATSVHLPVPVSNAFAAAGFPFWPMHPPLPVTSFQAPGRPPMSAQGPTTSTQLSTNGDENSLSTIVQNQRNATSPRHSTPGVEQPQAAPLRRPLADQELDATNGSPVVRAAHKKYSHAQEPIRGAASNPLKARSVLPSASASSFPAAPAMSVSTAAATTTNKQARHSPYPAAGPTRRPPLVTGKSISGPPLPPSFSRPNPHAKLAPPPPAGLAPPAKRPSLDRPPSGTPARHASMRAHVPAPPPPLSAIKSSRDSSSSTSGGTSGLLSTTSSASSSSALSAAAALASANAPGTPSKGVRLDIFALESDEEVMGGARAKRSATAATAGKESVGRRRALDKNKSMSVECLGVSSSSDKTKPTPPAGAQVTAPMPSLVDELDMLLGCSVIPPDRHISSAPVSQSEGEADMANRAILADIYSKDDAETDPTAAMIVDIILGQGHAHQVEHAHERGSTPIRTKSTQGEATGAPEWDPLDWLTGGSPTSAPPASASASACGSTGTGRVDDKENRAPLTQHVSRNRPDAESFGSGDAAKAPGELGEVMEWDIDKILMGS